MTDRTVTVPFSLFQYMYRMAFGGDDDASTVEEYIEEKDFVEVQDRDEN